MRKYIIIASLLTCLFFTGLLTGCDLQEALGELHGKWVSYNGLSLEFSNGRFTRVNADGTTDKGTYTTDSGFISFHSAGNSSEKFRYELDFPKLIVGEIIYFHDSPRVPEDVEGLWFLYMGVYSTHYFGGYSHIIGPAKPERGNPWVLKGEYRVPGSYKGEYTINARNIPNTGSHTMTITHVYGGDLVAFIKNRMPPYLTAMFDLDALDSRNINPELWWFSLDEARKLFTDAIQRANGDLAIEQHLINRMYMYNGGLLIGPPSPDYYDYTLEKVDGVLYDTWWGEVESDLLLTFRSPRGGIITLIKGEMEILQLYSTGKTSPVLDCGCKFSYSFDLLGCGCEEVHYAY